eukprot:CAMPEP_0119265140 /NCGR_PEP_ID=MMETSP1329-20130426/4041_1 /TAXON_ID=114041 /ORGANISM="Genus nov. species nov., Strain RCC1024" /LENGTH=209 /DNA_ID=CAMNT_0007264951 /DNA_START=151 /DNA_END=776 /DNA_ORIENTATION=-
MQNSALLLSSIAAACALAPPRPATRRIELRAVAEYVGAYPSGAADAFDACLQCLSLDADDEQCTISYLEDTFKAVDAESVRRECDSAMENQIDELWRVIKLMYGGATRREAIAARRGLPAARDGSVDAAYRLCLRFLNPATSEAAGASREALERALELLDCEGDECLALNEGQLQVLDQLRKVVARLADGMEAQAAVQATWDAREAEAR